MHLGILCCVQVVIRVCLKNWIHRFRVWTWIQELDSCLRDIRYDLRVFNKECLHSQISQTKQTEILRVHCKLQICWIVANWILSNIVHWYNPIDTFSHKSRFVRNESTQSVCTGLSHYCHWIVIELESRRIVLIQLVLLCSDSWFCKCDEIGVNAWVLESQCECC